MMMLRVTLVVCLAVVTSLTGAVSAPTGATITGKISATGKRKRLPTMVVYLKSTDAKRKFDAPAKDIVVKQQGAKFSPSLLVVARGQTVQFTNDEDREIEHNVFSRSPSQSFDLGLYPPGEGRSVTFKRPGEVRLFCSIHRYMDGVIYVCPTPFFAQVNKDGTYKIDNVPPGEYEVRTWQRKRRYKDQAQRITVEAGKAVEVNMEMKRK